MGTVELAYAVVAAAGFLLIPAALALCGALRGMSGGRMTAATVILLTYVAIDISTFVSSALAPVMLARDR